MNTDITNLDAAKARELEHAHHLEMKTFGFWIYLMSDLVIFSVLFATFAVHGKNYAGGPTPQQLYDIPYLFVETMFLLVSSVTYGLSMVAMQHNNKKMVLVGLVITFLLGLGFVSMEIHEFYGMIMSNAGPDRSGYLSSFFTLVGTHGTHVSFGLLWMGIMMYQVVKRGFTAEVRSRLMRLSLFWHFLDIVWVGVFTVVYLLGWMGVS
ncbi:MAG: cytochrome o ubiquinol oxidase subunit III [Bacteroidales bacterium]|nr:cytochrome o ubiquinol oxidase subunit III [Bacteroidales bacterium]